MSIRNTKDVSKSAICKKCLKSFFFGFREYSVCQPCLTKVLNDLGTLAKESNERIKKERDQKKKEELEKEREKIYSKHYKMREYLCDQSFRPVEKAEQVDRKCLKCDRSFVASGRFNRLCIPCREQNFNIRRSLSSDIIE